MKNGIFKSQPGAPLKRNPLHAPGHRINTPAAKKLMTPPVSFVSSGCGAAFLEHLKRNVPPKKIGTAGGHRRNTLSCRVGYESIKELAAARPFTQGFARAERPPVVGKPQSLDAALIEKGGNWEMSEQSFFHCAQKNPTGENGLPGIPFLLHYWGNGGISLKIRRRVTLDISRTLFAVQPILDSNSAGGWRSTSVGWKSPGFPFFL